MGKVIHRRHARTDGDGRDICDSSNGWLRVVRRNKNASFAKLQSCRGRRNHRYATLPVLLCAGFALWHLGAGGLEQAGSEVAIWMKFA